MNLFNVFCVALPSLNRTLGLIDAPEVDEFTLACNGNMFAILPFDFEASEVGIDVTMIERGDFLA